MIEYILFGINFYIGLLETILFYKVIYRRKICAPEKYQIFLLMGLFLLYVTGRIFSWNKLLISSMYMIADFFVCVWFTEIRLLENFKYWMVKFFSVVALEGVIQYGLILLMPFLDGEDIQIIFTTVILIGILCLCSRLTVFKESVILSVKSTFILSVSFGAVTILLSYMNILLNEFAGKQMQIIGMIVLFFAMSGSCIAIILFLYLLRQREHFQKQAILENEYNKQQREYFYILLDKERETSRMLLNSLCK